MTRRGSEYARLGILPICLAVSLPLTGCAPWGEDILYERLMEERQEERFYRRAANALRGAIDALGQCSPGYQARNELGNLIARMERELASVEGFLAGGSRRPSGPNYWTDAQNSTRDAKRHAINCGVLTPEMMDAPTAGVEWWDFSS